MSYTDLQVWAADETKRLERNAVTYGDLALKFRARANIFQLILSVLTLASGTSGFSGLFSMPWEQTPNSVILASVISILMSVVTAYIQTYNPREKEFNYMKANSINTALAGVTELIAETHEPDVENLSKSIFSTLESAFEDELPYIKSKEKES